jgi:hypothetical protein
MAILIPVFLIVFGLLLTVVIPDTLLHKRLTPIDKPTD